jgi:hypothetical protein
MLRCLACAIFLLAVSVRADLLDPESAGDEWLQQLVPHLQANGIDAARNLNARALKPRKKPVRPRLGYLPDISRRMMANAIELAHWEAAHTQGLIGGLAAIPRPPQDSDFTQSWWDTPSAQRSFVSFATTDQANIALVGQAFSAAGLSTLLMTTANNEQPVAGQFYATAGRRLSLDSENARKLDTEARELSLLGRKLRRKSNSVYPATGKSSQYYAASEPDRFHKMDLGDELVAAVIPEIIVSGGIALGEVATFEPEVQALRYRTDQGLSALLAGSTEVRLQAAEATLLRACFDFAVRSIHIESDAIIDIDERGRIKISSAFRDTDIGFQLIDIDQQPFAYIDRLNVIKSVIIDSSVHITEQEATLGFVTDYEVRFIRPDRRKLAETRAALQYRYNSFSDESRYQNSWGVRAFRTAAADLDGLGEATRRAATVAGWVALFRAVESSDIDFSRGRYEFLRIDTTGRATPKRSTGYQ